MTLTLKLHQKIKKLFLQTLDLIIKNPILLALTLAVSFSASLVDLSSEVIVKLIFIVFWIGWSGIEVELIQKLYLKQPVYWNELILIFFKYLKKMLPTILAIFLIIIVAVPLLIALSVALVIGPVLAYSFMQLRPYLVDQLLVNFTIKAIAIYFSSIISVYISQTLVVMVATQKNLYQSFSVAKNYFLDNLVLFSLLAVIITGVNSIAWQLPNPLMRIVITSELLLLNTMILIHYYRNAEKPTT